MLLGRIAVLTFAVVMIAVAREPAQTTVTVKELPPEAIPTGPCVESIAGFLGVVGMGQKERTKLTAEEIGTYVSKRLAEGYSVTLYPQVSGKIFAVARRHSASALHQRKCIRRTQLDLYHARGRLLSRTLPVGQGFRGVGYFVASPQSTCRLFPHPIIG
jgi:hypothetical protein